MTIYGVNSRSIPSTGCILAVFNTAVARHMCSIGCNSIRYDLKRECSFTNLVTQMTTVTTPTEWVPNIPVIISGKIHLIGQMKLWHHK